MLGQPEGSTRHYFPSQRSVHSDEEEILTLAAKQSVQILSSADAADTRAALLIFMHTEMHTFPYGLI